MRTFPTSSTEIETEHHDAVSPLGSVHQSPATAGGRNFFNDKFHTPSPQWKTKRRQKKELRSSSSSSSSSLNSLKKSNDNADDKNAIDEEEDDEGDWTETGYVLPTEPQMVLLCLDYLRTLVRSHNIRELEEQHCLNHKAISAAVDELSKAFLPTHVKSDFNLLKELEEESIGGGSKENNKHSFNRFNKKSNTSEEEEKDDDLDHGIKKDISLPPINLHEGTDPFDLIDNDDCGSANGDDDSSLASNGTNGTGGGGIGGVSGSTSILHRKRNAAARKAKKSQMNQKPRYTYIDLHPSNAERFFSLSGLSSSQPLSLGEVVASGLVGLNARTRRAAERDICENQMFQQFLDAVASRGFFEGIASPTPPDEKDLDSSFARTQAKRRQAQYEAKFYKVVEKFRLKLAKQAAAEEEECGRTLLTPSSGIMTVATNALLDGSGMNAGTVVVSTTADEGFGGAAQNHDNASVYTNQTHKSNVSASKTSVSVRSCSGAKGLVPTDATRVLATNMAELHRQQHKDVQEQFFGNEGVGHKQDDEEDDQPSSLKIVEYHPDDIEHAEAFKQKGNKCMQKKFFKEAIDHYSKALRICPSSNQSHVYYSNRSAALLSLKHFEDAVEDGERALALDPTYGKAHGRLGWAYYCLGRYEDAIDAYELAMKYDPDHAASHKKQWKAAKSKYEDQNQRLRREGELNGKSLEPKVPAPTHSSVFDEEENMSKQELIRQKEAEALKIKGNSYMSQREYGKAIDVYTQAIQLCPHGPNSHIYFSNRSAALCYVQKYEQAELDAEESLSLNPEYPKAYARLGLARFFLQDYEGSIDAYQTALEFEPENAAAQSYLAKAKKRLTEEENDAR